MAQFVTDRFPRGRSACRGALPR